MDKKASVIQDLYGNKVVIVNDVIFKGKSSLDWKDVKKYIKNYIGEFYIITDSRNVVFIGADLPTAYTGSIYTKSLKGTTTKAKANVAQAIPEMIEIAKGKHYRPNQVEKHKRNAKYGWYRYDSRFGLPAYDESGNVLRYNIFHVSMLIRHANNGKMYLYDVIDIKKRNEQPFHAIKSLTQQKPIS